MRVRSLHDIAGLGLAAALVSACAPQVEPAWSGYAEADYVYVASPVGGTLQTLSVRRGQQVAQGAPLFTLESEAERAARDEAQARFQSASAQAADAQKGRRPDEIAMAQATLAQARAELQRADAEYARQRQLVAQGFISQSRLDDARAAAEASRQRVAEAQAALRVSRLPAREDQRHAAAATAQAAHQALRQTEWRAGQKEQRAITAAQVADTFFRPGEYVVAGQPVLSLLPPGATRARFFVPESEIATVAVGQSVSLHCDGCGQPIAARIDFVSAQAEYTPPVIYSNAQRSRLMFMVEARPEPKDAGRLKPGMPLDVKRAGARHG